MREQDLELGLAGGDVQCALDVEGVTIELLNFEELDKTTNSVTRGFRLAEVIDVSGCVGARGGGGDACM